ncbi:MAG TPA: hypothetical protein VFV50_04215, partial [Bdellovibrionales bacterium]|nr:hypothetical protein [Bdellovibrionales bacterium]
LEPSQQLELGFENDVGREPRTARAPAKAMGEACAVSGAKIDGQSAAKTDGSNNEPDLTVEQALSLKQAMAFEQIRFLAEVKELAQVLKSRK